MKMIFLAAIPMLLTSPAWAGKTEDLYAACTSVSGTKGEVLCAAYINGFVSGVLADQVARESGKAICMPDMNTSQVRDVFTAYMKANQQLMTNDTGGTLGYILSLYFPCKD